MRSDIDLRRDYNNPDAKNPYKVSGMDILSLSRDQDSFNQGYAHPVDIREEVLSDAFGRSEEFKRGK